MTSTRKRASRLVALSLLIVALLIAGRAVAAPLAADIAWWVVAAGGGPSSGAGGLVLDSTLGQPIAGESSATGITLGAGYWYGAQAKYSMYLPDVLRGQ